MKITQRRFDELIDNLNHKVTKVQNDIKWMRWIGYYMSAIITYSVIGGML